MRIEYGRNIFLLHLHCFMTFLTMLNMFYEAKNQVSAYLMNNILIFNNDIDIEI